MDSKPGKSSKRFLRISLGTVLLILTVFCIWLASVTQRAKNQKQTLALLQEAGGAANFRHEAYDWPLPPSSFPSDTTFDGSVETPGPKWLHDALGHDFFRVVVSVDLPDGKPATEELVRACAKLPDLRWADFSYNKISDQHLETLGTMAGLQILILDRNQISDDGLQHVTNLSSLETLELSMNRRLAGNFLRDGMKLRMLKELDLQLTPFEGANLKFIEDHPSLEQIMLRETKIENEHMVHLAKMPQLRILDLGKTAITSDGIAELAKGTQLIHLYLEGPNVTNDWVPYLSAMKTLEHLALWNTEMDDDAVARLKKALPKCDISHR